MSTDRTPTADEATEIIRGAIAAVAPELEPELRTLDPDIDLWVELELDSMDHLAVMTRIAEQTGVEIPEREYPRMTTLAALRDHLTAHG